MLKALKADLAGQPENQALKEQIRILDLAAPAEVHVATGVCRRGRRAAAGRDRGAAGGGHVGGHLAAEIAPAAAAGSGRDRQAEWTPLARWAVAGVGVALAVAAAVLIARCGPLPWQATSQPEGTVPVFGPGTTRRVAAANLRDSPLRPRKSPAPGRASADPAARESPPTRMCPKVGTAPRARTSSGRLRCRCPATTRRWSGAIASFSPGPMRTHREVFCFDAADGRLLWQKEVPAGAGSSQSCKVRDDVGFASPTMATDGRLAAAVFANGDVAAFDFQGELIWSQQPGRAGQFLWPRRLAGHFSRSVIGSHGSRPRRQPTLEAPGAGRGHGKTVLAAAAPDGQHVVFAHRDPRAPAATSSLRPAIPGSSPTSFPAAASFGGRSASMAKSGRRRSSPTGWSTPRGARIRRSRPSRPTATAT